MQLILSDGGRAAFPGRNGLITFETCRYHGDDPFKQVRLYGVRPNGKRLRRITTLSRYPFSAGCSLAHSTWSPDGTRALYEDGSDTWMLNPKTNSKQRIARHAIHPAWGPSGQRFLFVDWRDDAASEEAVFRQRVRGGRARRVTPWVNTIGAASWSSDGRFIAFWRWDPGAPPRQTIWRARAGGGGLRLLAGDGRFVDWSPNGRRLVYVDYRDVWLMRADGSRKRNLTRHRPRTETYAAAWSPDGRQIAYITRPHKEVFIDEIRVLNLRTRKTRRLSLPRRLGNPAWLSWRPVPRKR